MPFAPYYDEKGSYHSHDPNFSTVEFVCSRGHKWIEHVINQCPDITCNYGREKVN